jgi:hypothetical protein
MLKGLVVAAIAASAVTASLATPSAVAAGTDKTQTFTIQASSRAIISVGWTNQNQMLVLSGGSGTTIWVQGCTESCSTTYTDGHITYPLVPCADDCRAPDEPFGIILVRIGKNGAWGGYAGGPTKFWTNNPRRIFVAYNDDKYSDNTGRYVHLHVTLSPPGR